MCQICDNSPATCCLRWDIRRKTWATVTVTGIEATHCRSCAATELENHYRLER